MSPIADTTTTRSDAGGALAGDPPRDAPDPVRVGEAGAPELLDDERRGRHRGILPPGSRALRGRRLRAHAAGSARRPDGA